MELDTINSLDSAGGIQRHFAGGIQRHFAEGIQRHFARGTQRHFAGGTRRDITRAYINTYMRAVTS